MEIENIKDAVYELEGLLELAELREDKLSALIPLMNNKLDAINSLFAELKAGVAAAQDDSENFKPDSPLPEPEIVEEEEIVEEPKEMEEAEEETPAIYNTPDEDDEEVYVPLISPLPQDEESNATVPTIPIEPQNLSDEEVAEAVTVNETYSDDFSSSFTPEYEIPDDDETPLPSQEKNESSRHSADPNAPKPAFCINDRFRFRRELFGNSDAEFSAAMDLVATMADYEEAEDYFFADRGWNPEQPEVMDFMAIIRNYFDK